MNNQSSITKLILKLGLAKSEKQVPVVLIAIIALAVVVMFMAWPTGSESERTNPTLSVLTVVNASV